MADQLAKEGNAQCQEGVEGAQECWEFRGYSAPPQVNRLTSTRAAAVARVCQLIKPEVVILVFKSERHNTAVGQDDGQISRGLPTKDWEFASSNELAFETVPSPDDAVRAVEARK